ncbi:MAG: hypothetical protein ABIR81_10610 [Ginsengibacter sp.]
MKIFIVCLLLASTSFASAEEAKYTASTPAGPVVKNFIGILLDDSVDFIRWKLTLQTDSYTLECSYGISKPNTNGFINGGTTVSLAGKLIKSRKYYQLEYNNKHLKLFVLNNDLLHIVDANDTLLVGNGGWSYTLNTITPQTTADNNFTAIEILPKDSAVFDGRTPCGIPGYIPAGKLCYKIKWRITMYGAASNQPGTWRTIRGKSGKYKIIQNKNGQSIYELNDHDGTALLYLVRPSNNILLFTNAEGQLLTGNEDFSYTLNRIR